jgi:hypothetical protein
MEHVDGSAPLNDTDFIGQCKQKKSSLPLFLLSFGFLLLGIWLGG